MSITKYYKIIKPRADNINVLDSQDISGSSSAAYSWYHKMVQGSNGRMMRYREYDSMDNDIDVSRALDIIALEIAGNTSKSQSPLLIEITAGHEQLVKSSTVVTLNAALKTWCAIQSWHTRLYRTIRNTIKYGDQFFIKPKKSYQKYYPVTAKNVENAIVPENDVTKIVGWSVRSDYKRYNHLNSGGNTAAYGNEANLDIYAENEIVRFSLNNEMTEDAPFGESLLRSVYTTFKQKELLEHAVLIYRIQRAPERRVFRIDVGGMHPSKISHHLEQVKNDFRQKKIPTDYSGQQSVESTYNPQCLDLDTKIPLLDGRTLKLSEIIEEFNQGKKNWVYSINPETGAIVPGSIDWAGITRENADVIKITLDNGDELICTPDHNIPVKGKGKIRADELTENDSLFSFNTKQTPLKNSKKKFYKSIYDHSINDHKFVHRIVSDYMQNYSNNSFSYNEKYINDEKNVIHHKNFNKNDNTPDNLVLMNSIDHIIYHSDNANPSSLIKYNNEIMNNVEKMNIHKALTSAGLIKKIKTDKKFHSEISERIKSQAVYFNNKHLNISEDVFNMIKKELKNNINITKKEFIKLLNSSEEFLNLWNASNLIDNNKKSYKITINKILPNKLSEKGFERIFKDNGYTGYRDFRSNFIVDNVDNKNIMNYCKDVNKISLINFLISHMKLSSVHGRSLSDYFNKNENYKNELFDRIKLIDPKYKHNSNNKVYYDLLDDISIKLGFENYKKLVNKLHDFNHKIIKIEKISNRNVGTITVDGFHKYHDYHTFAIETSNDNNFTTGIFVYNSMHEDFFVGKRSDGSGTEIEVLPSGQNLGQLEDLDYFYNRLFRGLRIPKSFVDATDGGGTFNDGAVGIAYQQEIVFSLHIEQIQKQLEVTFDKEFKLFLDSQNIKIDQSIFKVILPEPSNFAKSRLQAINDKLISTYASISENPHISPRFAQEKYLMWTKEEIILNQRLKLEEMGIDPNKATKKDLIRIYNPNAAENEGIDGGIGGDPGLDVPIEPSDDLNDLDNVDDENLDSEQNNDLNSNKNDKNNDK